MRAATCAALACLVSCGGAEPRGQRADVADRCIAAYAKGVTSPQFPRQQVWRACADIYREQACRLAFEWDAPPPEQLDACRTAYCPTLPEPKPSACGDRARSSQPLWEELLIAIWNYELGDRDADRLEAAVRIVGNHVRRDGNSIATQGMFTRRYGVSLPPAPEPPVPAQDPVLTIREGHLVLDGEILDAVANLGDSDEVIPRLYARLTQTGGSALTIQAPKGTSADLLNRIMQTARDAGHGDIEFTSRRPALGTLSLLIRTDGYVIGDKESGTRVWIPVCDDGGYDGAALSTAVCASRTSGYAPRDHVEVAAVGSLPYQTLIEAMDYTIRGGIPNVRLVDPASLPLVSPTEGAIDGARSVPRQCGEEPAKCLAPELPYDFDRNPPADTPILVVTPDEALLDGVVIAKVSEIAALGAEGKVTKLYDALRKRPGDALILQADKALDAHVINRLLMTAYDAGRDNVLFAVNRR